MSLPPVAARRDMPDAPASLPHKAPQPAADDQQAFAALLRRLTQRSSGFLGGSGSDGATVGGATQSAHMFNEQGLFGRATLSVQEQLPARTPDPSQPRTATLDGDKPSASAGPEAADTGEGARFGGAHEGAAHLTEGPRPAQDGKGARGMHPAAAIASTTTMSASGAGTISNEAPVIASPDRGSGGSTTRGTQARSDTAPVRAAFLPGGEGLDLAIRVPDLDRAGGTRLRNLLLALLSRHGWKPGSITLNGRAGAPEPAGSGYSPDAD